MNLDEFLALSLEARRKASVRRKPRGPYMRRLPRTPEQLIDYLRSHNIRSVRQLRKIRAAEDPNLYDFTKAYMSWNAAKELAFGKPDPFSLPRRPDPAYIINCILEYDLWTRDAYQAAHLRLPDLIPSIYWPRILFGGSWEKVRWAAEQKSLKASLERWMNLRRRLGKSPTVEELANAGISLAPLKQIYPGRVELNEFLNQIGRLADEKEKAVV